MNLRKSAALALAVSIAFPHSNVYALPDPAKSSAGLGRFQSFAQAQSSTLAGVFFLEDHAKPNVLYVSPASRKAQSGGYQPIQSAQCDLLADQYRVTYNYPSHVSPEKWLEIANRGPYSPAFDAQYGNANYYSSVLRELAAMIARINQIREAHADIYGEFVSSKEMWAQAQAAISNAKSTMDGYDQRMTDLVNRMALVQTPEERQTLQSELAALRAERELQLPALRDAWRQSIGQEMIARARYQNALRAWAPYQTDLTDIIERQEAISKIYELNQTIAVAAFARAEALLNNFENRIVGVAGAGYNIWGTEVADANSALSRFDNSRGYRVVPLPIFNFRASTGSSLSQLSFVDSSATGLGGGRSISRTVDAGVPQGQSTRDESHESTFRGAHDLPLVPQIAQASEGAGVINVPVRMGAFCTGKSGRAETRVRVNDVDGNQLELAVAEYRAKPSSSIHQAVAINYDYYAKAEPISVTCELNVSNYSSYMRSSGSKGFLFWRHSWDDTERNTTRSNGVDCHTSEAPTYLSPAEQTKYINALEQSMSQEVMAEFILQYAKSFRIEAEATNLPKVGAGEAFNRIGSSMMLLCGGNPYCTIGSLVLKSADELFGNSSGSTSNRESFNGTIRRSYARESFRVIPGSSEIDLTIDLPGVVL